MANDPRRARNDPQTPIFEHSIDAFALELKNLFNDRKTPTFLVKQQGNLDDVLKQQSDIKPPFFTFHLGDSALFEEGVVNERLNRVGLTFGGPKSKLDNQGQPVDLDQTFLRLNPINIEVNINVSYHCDFVQQIDFMQTWHKLSVKPVKFIIDYKGVDVPCIMTLDKSISYADVNFEEDSLVECQTNCSLRTWIVSEGRTRPISRYTVAGSIGELAHEDNAELARRYTKFSTIVDSDKKGGFGS